jgi:hypothetical protein
MAFLLVPAVVLVMAVPSRVHAQAGKRPSKQYTIEQFMATTSVTGASFSADEKRLLYSSNQTAPTTRASSSPSPTTSWPR